MIPFQFGTFFRVMTRRGATEPTLGSAIARRAGLAAIFPGFELVNAASLTLDAALFPFAHVQVESPIFVVGPPRSGTTRLHRLLAQDERFTTFRAWQIAFPSISTQMAVRGVMRLDKRLGGRFRRRIEAFQDAKLGGADGFHQTRLTEPEEDEALLVHAFASELLATPFPLPDVMLEYRAFDQLPEHRRKALMAFYRACVQRHLLIEGVGRQLLSKNPVFCHKIGSLRETFPDARFVVLVRHPCEAVSSLASLITWMRKSVGVGAPDADEREQILRFVQDCYSNTLHAVDTLPAGAAHVTRYEDMVTSPRAAVEAIYQAFGLPIGEKYRAVLDAEETRARSYQSRHSHSLDKIGLTTGEVEERLGFVYDRFGYARAV